MPNTNTNTTTTTTIITNDMNTRILRLEAASEGDERQVKQPPCARVCFKDDRVQLQPEAMNGAAKSGLRQGLPGRGVQRRMHLGEADPLMMFPALESIGHDCPFQDTDFLCPAALCRQWQPRPRHRYW